MMIHDLAMLRNLAIIFMFVVLFGTAAFDKFKTFTTPPWFIKQFEGTVIAKLPGGASTGYWMIGTFELALTIAFIAATANLEILQIALTGALFLFGMLCFGLRIISDFQGSANMFIYFSATLVSLMFIA